MHYFSVLFLLFVFLQLGWEIVFAAALYSLAVVTTYLDKIFCLVLTKTVVFRSIYEKYLNFKVENTSLFRRNSRVTAQRWEIAMITSALYGNQDPLHKENFTGIVILSIFTKYASFRFC